MTASLSRASHNKIGTCPHGLPMGACPICNGMGGGGSVKKDNKPREMTYNECLAVWQMMKAQKAAHKQTMQLFAAQDMSAYMNKLQEQINAMKIAIQNSALPRPIAKAFVLLADSVLLPAAKALQNISNTVQNIANSVVKTLNEIKQKIIDIADKLTALFGETKAAIQKKIEEKFNDIKKKIFNLFGLATAENEEDEEARRIEEAKQLFELNTAKEALFELLENPEKESPTKESEKV